MELWGAYRSEWALPTWGLAFVIDQADKNGEKFFTELNELIKKQFSFAHVVEDQLYDGGYEIEAKDFNYPKEWIKDGRLNPRYLVLAIKFFRETYGALNGGLENFVDKWLKGCGQYDLARKWLEAIASPRVKADRLEKRLFYL